MASESGCDVKKLRMWSEGVGVAGFNDHLSVQITIVLQSRQQLWVAPIKGKLQLRRSYISSPGVGAKTPAQVR